MSSPSSCGMGILGSDLLRAFLELAGGLLHLETLGVGQWINAIQKSHVETGEDNLSIQEHILLHVQLILGILKHLFSMFFLAKSFLPWHVFHLGLFSLQMYNPHVQAKECKEQPNRGLSFSTICNHYE